jgi:3-oxoacyl-[acyl-carrier-protein] synthase II
MKRVAITGLGMVTPLACGVEETWARLLAGQSGAGPITRFDASACATRYACEIPRGDGSNGSFDPDRWMAARDRRKVDEFIVYAMAAADQAVADAGWTPQDAAARDRTGVMIGSGIGGLATIAETATTLKEKGPRRVSPFFIPQFADQSRLGAGVDPLRFHGPEPRGGHGLFDRGACNR